jgi:predicted nucleic acid-binding Zn ribbon protein
MRYRDWRRQRQRWTTLMWFAVLVVLVLILLLIAREFHGA